MRWRSFLMGLWVLLSFQPGFSVLAEDLGRLSRNPFNPESTGNPFGAGSPYRPDSINNPYGSYGSPSLPTALTIPMALGGALKAAIDKEF